jgi:hypothetical protein
VPVQVEHPLDRMCWGLFIRTLSVEQLDSLLANTTNKKKLSLLQINLRSYLKLLHSNSSFGVQSITQTSK